MADQPQLSDIYVKLSDVQALGREYAEWLHMEAHKGGSPDLRQMASGVLAFSGKITREAKVHSAADFLVAGQALYDAIGNLPLDEQSPLRNSGVIAAGVLWVKTLAKLGLDLADVRAAKAAPDAA